MRISIALALLASVALPGAAQAADGTGFYGSLNIGGASVEDVDVTYFDTFGFGGGGGGDIEPEAVPAGADTLSGSYDLKTSPIFSGSLGYDWGMFRTEVEVSYARSRIRAFSVKELNGTPVTFDDEDADDFCAYAELSNCSISSNTVSFSGGPKLRQLNAMANVWVDIPVGGDLGIEPYVGGGLGVAGFEVGGEGKARFAWQLGGGLAYKLSSKIAITADLRYRQASGATLDDGGAGIDIDKIKTFSYGLGLRFGF